MEVRCAGCGRPVDKNHTHDGLCPQCRLTEVVSRPEPAHCEGQEELFP